MHLRVGDVAEAVRFYAGRLGLDPVRVASALRGGAPVPTVLGPVAFDAKGDIKDPRYAIYVWERDGQYRERP